MGLALLCSGQGFQHPAMFALLTPDEAARPLTAAISARLGAGVEDLAALDLHQNRTAQLLIVGQALAASATLTRLGMPEPIVTAGYSVGELAAHACAGCYQAGDALDLAVARATAMDKAAACGPPLGMTGVIGLDPAQVESCAAATGVALAIVNAPDHLVVGGPLHALERFEERAQAQGARHIRRLPVQIASHTRFLDAAGPVFAEALRRKRWTPASAPVLSGLDGHAIRNAEDAACTLSAQLHQPLDWHRCLMAAVEYGATAFLELGPGRALTTMVEQSVPGLPARALGDFRTMAGAAAWSRRVAENR